MTLTQLSLKGLEVFLAVARAGSVQRAAQDTGLSISTVSHHLRQLEARLGVTLFDHGRRPVQMTPAGAVFQRDVAEALRLLRRAEAAVQAGTLEETRALSMAMIEDLDAEIAPELARMLTTAMPGCRFQHLMRPSHEILEMLRAGRIDIGVAARPQFDAGPLSEVPLLRDPFVLALPKAYEGAPEALLAGQSALPLMRYAPNQIMAAQIEAQLRRLKIALPDRHAFDSNLTLMRLVADGAGWAITTPMNYLRAQRFQADIRLAPFPGKGFARMLALFAVEDADARVVETVAETLRRLIETRAVAPAVEAMPWLAGGFRML